MFWKPRGWGRLPHSKTLPCEPVPRCPNQISRGGKKGSNLENQRADAQAPSDLISMPRPALPVPRRHI
mgnify:FL=1